MATLNMLGPVPAESVTIREYVKAGTKGNYAFGYSHSDGTWIVRYVGRSDTDLQAEIIARRKDPKLSGADCSECMYSYANSVTEAYEKECQNYHDFGGDKKKLLNEIHPAKPKDNNHYKCPVCD